MEIKVLVRQAAYLELFASVIAVGEVGKIRYAADRGWPLDSDAFEMTVEQTLQRPARSPKRGRPSLNRDTPRAAGGTKVRHLTWLRVTSSVKTLAVFSARGN